MSQHVHTTSCGCAEAAKGLGDLYSLYSQVVMKDVETLNASSSSAGRDIIKPYDTRGDNTVVLESESDGEVIIRVPFTSQVKLKALSIRGAAGEARAPSVIKLWVNRDDIDFSNVHGAKPTQEIVSPYDATGDFKIPVKPGLFMSTSKLTIYLTTGDEESELSVGYLGLFGQPTKNKHGIVNVVYEARANPADHSAEDVKNKSLGHAL